MSDIGSILGMQPPSPVVLWVRGSIMGICGIVLLVCALSLIKSARMSKHADELRRQRPD